MEPEQEIDPRKKRPDDIPQVHCKSNHNRPYTRLTCTLLYFLYYLFTILLLNTIYLCNSYLVKRSWKLKYDSCYV